MPVRAAGRLTWFEGSRSMLDSVLRFFSRLPAVLANALRRLGAALLWPFRAGGRWLGRKGWLARGIAVALLVLLVLFYGYFFYATQFWKGFDPDYPQALVGTPDAGDPGEPVAGGACKPSQIVAVSAGLIDFNVNRNAWISSMLASKMGLFGVEWRHTPFFDNKAAFQLGINQVLRRTTTELVDTLGRVRGTSQIDQNLQDARTAMAWSETAWYVGLRGPTRPTPSVYREAIRSLRAFNDALVRCQATFDARADNLMQYLDRMAGDIGSTADILRQRIADSDAGWFDLRADDRFWFSYGQLYAYYGLMKAAQADFEDVIKEKHLQNLWETMDQQFVSALAMQPLLIVNSSEQGIFASHLTTMGFYVLRVRSNMVEISNVLAQ